VKVAQAGAAASVTTLQQSTRIASGLELTGGWIAEKLVSLTHAIGTEFAAGVSLVDASAHYGCLFSGDSLVSDALVNGLSDRSMAMQ
jgi:hypothetical protein